MPKTTSPLSPRLNQGNILKFNLIPSFICLAIINLVTAVTAVYCYSCFLLIPKVERIFIPFGSNVCARTKVQIKPLHVHPIKYHIQTWYHVWLLSLIT